MPCIPEDEIERRLIQPALDRLAAQLGDGTARVVIGAQGAVAFAGWTDNRGVSDVCALRALTASNSPELRRALMRAEVTAGRKVNFQAVSTGLHSHDGGKTWSQH